MIGALVNNLGPTQLSFQLIRAFNQISSNKFNPVVFYQNLAATAIEPNFATMNMYYLPHFTGSAIATDLLTAKTLLDANVDCRRYFYIYDLFWLRNPVDFNDAMRILRNKDISLITRSESHRKYVENYSNRSSRIISDFNVEDLKRL